MKIGILTHYNVYNHGAQLQMLAMKSWLENQGHRVTILTYEKNFDFNKDSEKKNSASVSNFDYYVKNYLLDKGLGLTLFNIRKVLALKKGIQALPMAPYDHSGLDAVIIGSDEVFSIDVGCNTMMYGHGLKSPAIAYAPAFGRATLQALKDYNCYDLIREGLSNMYALSARDVHTQEMIRSLTGREVPLVCDPVILYSGKAFLTPVKPVGKKFLLVYSYSRHMTDPDEIREIRAYAKRRQLITVSLGNYHGWCDRNVVCDPLQWYSYFREAECVVTDTFHGAVVSMKNHCNLAVFIRPSINAFKMESLLENTGLQHRRLEALTAENLERVLSERIDYEAVEEKLAEMVRFSENYLKNALEKLHEA